MFDAGWAGQIAWLLPAAFASILVVWFLSRERMHRVATVLWGGWLVVTWATFSFSQGIIHEYYSVALAPAIAALVAMATVVLYRRGGFVGLGVLLGGSAVYAALLLMTANYDWLGWIVGVVGVVAAVVLGLGDLTPMTVRKALVGALVAVSLLGPLSFSLETASRVTSGSLPTAGPSLGASTGPGGGTRGPAGQAGGPGGLLNSPDVSSELVSVLSQDARTSPGSPRGSAARPPPGTNWPPDTRSWRSAGSTAAIRRRRWSSSSSTSPRAGFITSSSAIWVAPAGAAVQRSAPGCSRTSTPPPLTA
ncbi:MAG: hypothetical protein V9E82_05965 [Candidatus Nanopelagicales bacterium]